MKKFYLYRHLDLEGIPFYIGKGTVNEKFTFKSKRYPRAYGSGLRNKDWYEKSRNGFTVEIIGEFDSLRQVLELENNQIIENISCINKQLNTFPEDKYEIEKIDDRIGKIITNFGIFYIFSSGIVLTDNGNILTPNDTGKGYLQVNLCGDGTSINPYIHRLVALVFVSNPDNKSIVNHKDFNRYNNNSDNLEWVTPLENTLHAIFHKRRKRKIVIQYDRNWNIIKEWENTAKFASFYGLNENYVQMICAGNIKQSKELHSYKEFYLKYKD